MTELVIVTAIVGVMASIASLHFYSSIEYHRLQSAADRLSSDLQLVRSQALKNQQPSSLDITTATCSYIAAGVPDMASPADDIAVCLANQPYDVNTMTILPADEPSIVFDATGMPNGPHSITLQQGDKTIVINVDEKGSVNKDP